MKPVLRLCRDHLHFLIVVPLLIVAMTWPMFPNVFDADAFWLPTREADAFMKIWDAWYGIRILDGAAELYFSDLLFHPIGVSLRWHALSLPHMFVLGTLQKLIALDDAYTLTNMLTVLVNMSAVYVALLVWFRNKWVALAGAVYFGLNQFVLGRLHHPDLTSLATIPLSLCALRQGLMVRRWKWFIVSGILLGVTAFISMYIFVPLLLTFGIYLLYMTANQWRETRFWQSVALLLAVAAAIAIWRVYPMLVDRAIVEAALEKSGGHRDADLVSFFVNPSQPLIGPILNPIFPKETLRKSGDAFLGCITLLVIGYAIFSYRPRRELAPWITAALFFFILRLGHNLIVNEHDFSEVVLPLYYLDDLFPWIFKAIRNVAYFQVGLLFPMVVLLSYGLCQIYRNLPARWRPALLLFFALAIAFEHSRLPPQGLRMTEDQFAWIDWFGQEDNQEGIHLIHLPMRSDNPKFYGFYQALSGYPHAEGNLNRTPSAAYSYIKSNYFLNHWQSDQVINCLPGNRAEFIAGQEQLLSDGFTHIVQHHFLLDERIAPQFANIPAAYRDEHVSIFYVEDLDESCTATAFLNPDAPSHLQDIEQTTDIPWQNSKLLSLLPETRVDTVSARSFTAVLYGLHGYKLLNDIDVLRRPSSDSPESEALKSSEVIFLTYDPSLTDSDRADRYRSWLATNFSSCGRLTDSDVTVIEFFLRLGFPCELALADAPLEVNYDNGIQLGNLLASASEERLELDILWKRLPVETHAISVQLFDENDTKAIGQDFVFRTDTLNHYDVDLTDLAPGTYIAKLIVYNYETGASVPGTILSSQSRFDRELEIARLNVES